MTRGVQFKRRMQRLLIHLILIIFSIIMIVPFVWMTLTAFKTVTEATSVSPFVIFPSQWRTDAFTTVWNNMNFLVLYKNTLLLIFFRVVCACLTATLAGYAFARLKFKGRDFMFSLILFQMMIPSQIFIGLAKSGRLADLSDEKVGDIYDKYKDRIIYYEDEEGKKIPVGIDVSEGYKAAGLTEYTDGKAYIGLSAYAADYGYVEKFVDYMVELGIQSGGAGCR